MNTREISLTAMLSAMLFVFTSISMVMPVPVGVVGLYVFRKFERSAVRALFISRILQVFFLVFAFFDIFIMLTWACSVIQDWLISVMFIRESFTFSNSALFNMGGITSLPFIIFVIMIAWGNIIPLTAFPYDYTMMLATMGAYTGIIIAFLLTYFCGGMSMLIGFKIVKRVLDKYMIKVEMFDQIIGDINV